MNSAATSRKVVPAVYRKVLNTYGWAPGTFNLDLGGGKFDLFTQALGKHGVMNFVWDPYNRSLMENKETLDAIEAKGGADTVTLSNVLCVIRKYRDQEELLEMAYKHARNNALIFVTVYEGTKSGWGRKTRDGYQHNKPLRSYLRIVEKVFPGAEVRNGMIVAVA